MLFDILAKIFTGPMDDDEKVRLAQKEIETEDSALVGKMLKRRPRLDPAKMQWFSEQESIDLSTARTNKEIYNRGGRGLFVISMDGTPATTLIRFNDIASSTYEVRAGHIKGAFQRIYLTNAAEAGKTLKFVVGYRNFAEFDLLGAASIVQLKNIAATTINPATKEGLDAIAALDFATQTTLAALAGEDFATQTTLAALAGEDFATQTTLAALAGVDFATQTTLALIKAKTDNLVPKITQFPVVYNVTMTLADTEYSQALLAGTKGFNIHTTDWSEFRLAYIPGKVAAPTTPWVTVAANHDERWTGLDADITLYFATPVAGKIMQIQRF